MGNRNMEPVNGGGDWVVTKPEHWMFRGTGMKKGDRIAGLVGWEFHDDAADIQGLEVVADGHGRQPSESRLYISDKNGNVTMLPQVMDAERIRLAKD